jgi:uncharacterized membrane protein
MAYLEFFEHSLAHLVAIVKFCLESLSVICVILGLIKTLQLAIRLNRRYQGENFHFNKIRLRFGMWLSLALEFQLGADIVATTVAPSLEALGNLALIALVRTFLNYFLSKELEAELALEKEQADLNQIGEEISS